MSKRINTHIHTAYSDGKTEINEVVDLLVENNVSFFAITDHDNVKSVDYLIEHAGKMDFVSGVELTGYIDFYGTCLSRHHSLHILAYDFDTENMSNYLKRWDERRKLALRKYLLKQKIQGNVFTECNSRTALAKEMASKGLVNTFMEGVQCINEDTNFEVCVPTLKDVFDAVAASGGVSVWAHPFECLNYNVKTLLVINDVEKIVNTLIGYGLNGIESDYCPYSEQQKTDLRKLAAKHKLFYSCGTDYHAREGDKLYVNCELTDGSLINYLQNRKKPEFIRLTGGRSIENVKKKDNLVYRSTTNENGQVIQFLNFLQSRGFIYSPRYIKSENGFNIFSYIHGYVPENIGRTTQYQLNEFMRIIKELHDLSVIFTKDSKKVVCHNDLSPCNTVFFNEKPVGIIDWDTISYGERWQDLTYIVWLWLNLGSHLENEVDLILGMIDALHAYGADKETKSNFAEKFIWRMDKVITDTPTMSSQYERLKDWVNFSKDWVTCNKNKIKELIG